MKKIAILCLLFASCAPSIQNHKTYNPTRPKKSEVKQRQFVNVWTIAGVVVIAWAVQDGIENRERK